jgi:hypothetical protein
MKLGTADIAKQPDEQSGSHVCSQPRYGVPPSVTPYQRRQVMYDVNAGDIKVQQKYADPNGAEACGQTVGVEPLDGFVHATSLRGGFNIRVTEHDRFGGR